MKLSMANVDKDAIILDSSVWIAYFYKEDNQHTKAVSAMAKITTHILIPEYVLLEVVTLLRQKGYNDTACQFMAEVTKDNDRLLIHGEEYFTDTVSLFRAAKNSKLSFVDTALLVLSQKYTVVTFDTVLNREIMKVKR